MKTNNRWWENYLVRYLAGNIFAIFVIFYLFLNYGDKIGDRFCHTNLSQQYTICKNQKTDNNPNFSKEVFSFLFQSTTTTNTLCAKNILDKTTTEISFINFIIISIFGFLYMYISSIPIYLMHIFRFGISHDGLKESANMRDAIRNSKCCDKNNFTPTYIESYTHVREHGNAFGIILMEILFAFYLVSCDFSISAVLVWITFGFVGWFYGIYLEHMMINKKWLKGIFFCGFIGLVLAICILCKTHF